MWISGLKGLSDLDLKGCKDYCVSEAIKINVVSFSKSVHVFAKSSVSLSAHIW